MSAAEEAWFEARPKGTVLRVTPTAGQRFEVEAEGGTCRDFILHAGSPAQGFAGRTSRHGGARVFWSSSMLARWVVQGRCSVELVPAGGSQ